MIELGEGKPDADDRMVRGVPEEVPDRPESHEELVEHEPIERGPKLARALAKRA